MKDYTNKIEKYLRGQMSHEEEARFEEKVKSNALVRFQAGFMAMLIRRIKNDPTSFRTWCFLHLTIDHDSCYSHHIY